MSVSAFLADLSDRDIRITANGDKLRCNAPTGALTSEIRVQIQQRKDEILEFMRLAESVATQAQAIVPMQPRGTRIPVFAAGGHNSDIFAFQDFVRNLDDDQPFYGLHPPGLDDDRVPFARIEDLAEYYATEIKAFRPEGPYIIAGYCAGGALVVELARKLQQRGAEISFVALFGCTYPTDYRFVARIPYWLKRVFGHLWKVLKMASFKEGFCYLRERFRRRAEQVRIARTPPAQDAASLRKFQFEQTFMKATRRYRPKKFAGRICLINPNQSSLRYFRPKKWQSLGKQTESYVGPDRCDINRMLLDPDAPSMVALFNQAYEDGVDPLITKAVK